MATIRIDSRFRGPSTSGNGGVSSGLVAGALGGSSSAGAVPVEVTLRAPPPLDVDLLVERTGEGITVRHGATVVAMAREATLDDDVPDPVDLETARRATAGYRNRDFHPLPECFVCGTSRDAPDGLRIHPGPVEGRSVVASPWTPTSLDDDGTGHVRIPIVWGALDCPSFMGLQTDVPLALLGRLTALVERTPRIDESCVVIGWPRGLADGRKLFGGAAVFGEDGTRLGWSHAVWIEVDPATFADATR